MPQPEGPTRTPQARCEWLSGTPTDPKGLCRSRTQVTNVVTEWCVNGRGRARLHLQQPPSPVPELIERVLTCGFILASGRAGYSQPAASSST